MTDPAPGPARPSAGPTETVAHAAPGAADAAPGPAGPAPGRDAAHVGLLAAIERFYDAVPRDTARVEPHGSLVLFVRTGPGHPYYARPRPDATAPVTAADLAAVRRRQRELGVPEALEWVHEVNPELLALARATGLAVLEAPLMVLRAAALPELLGPAETAVRLLDPADPGVAADLADRAAVVRLAFAAPGTAPGAAGPADRAATRTPLTEAELAEHLRGALTGRLRVAVAGTAAEGVLAGGALLRVGEVAEIAGVGTLPAARRRGWGATVTVMLARAALTAGARTVLLSAGGPAQARLYARLGFHRVGTACIAEPA